MSDCHNRVVILTGVSSGTSRESLLRVTHTFTLRPMRALASGTPQSRGRVWRARYVKNEKYNLV